MGQIMVRTIQIERIVITSEKKETTSAVYLITEMDENEPSHQICHYHRNHHFNATVCFFSFHLPAREH